MRNSRNWCIFDLVLVAFGVITQNSILVVLGSTAYLAEKLHDIEDDLRESRKQRF